MKKLINPLLFLVVITLIILLVYKTYKAPNIVTATATISTNLSNNSHNDAKINVDDKQKIHAIIKEYLINNPEIVIEAIEALKKRKVQEAAVKVSDYIKAHKHEIENDAMPIVLGNADSDLTIVSFFDYRCSYCKTSNTYLEEFIKSNNNVKVILKHFPLLGPESEYVSKVAIAVHKISPEKFANIHSELMQLRQYDKESVESLLESHGIQITAINDKISTPEIQKAIDNNITLARNINIQGTPAYIINEEVIMGVMDLQRLNDLVQAIKK